MGWETSKRWAVAVVAVLCATECARARTVTISNVESRKTVDGEIINAHAGGIYKFGEYAQRSPEGTATHIPCHTCACTAAVLKTLEYRPTLLGRPLASFGQHEHASPRFFPAAVQHCIEHCITLAYMTAMSHACSACSASCIMVHACMFRMCMVAECVRVDCMPFYRGRVRPRRLHALLSWPSASASIACPSIRRLTQLATTPACR
jgi:hypothetical protein